MAALTIRNLPDDIHHALQQRATQHGRSTAAEVRAILEQAVGRPQRLDIGAELALIADRYGGLDLEIQPRTDLPRIATFD